MWMTSSLLAAARDHPELGGAGRSVDVLGREFVLVVLFLRRDPEHRDRSVRAVDFDHRTGFELVQPVKDRGTGLGIDMTGDDARADLAGHRPVDVPAGKSKIGRHLECVVRVQAERYQRRFDVDLGDPDRERRQCGNRRGRLSSSAIPLSAIP